MKFEDEHCRDCINLQCVKNLVHIISIEPI